MSFWSSLPRFIRPPANLRKEIEKINPGHAISDGIKNAAKQAGEVINTTRQQVQQASDDVNKAKTNTDIIKWAVIGIGIVILFVFVLKKRA